MILEARGEGQVAQAALNNLCSLYWQPVYAFLRRKGNSPADAEDLTQGFFKELLSRGSLDDVAQEKGRLRTFLLKAVTRHMINAHEKLSAAKRGGGQALLSLDFESAEGQYQIEPGHAVTPELEFERQWALRLLDNAFAEVRGEAETNGRSGLFEDLKGVISLDAAVVAYDEIASRHQLTEGAVKAAAHRLRQGFRNALRRAIAQTVASQDEVDEEIQHLFQVFQAP
ncbi:MAG TPA: sigma factor [Luteolibacter sp.]|nr:sigma factor [Luteolibacter sp.]